MKANIVITPDGQISIITQEGNLEGGQAAINKLLAALNVQGTKIKLNGPIEQHRHTPGQQVHNHIKT